LANPFWNLDSSRSAPRAGCPLRGTGRSALGEARQRLIIDLEGVEFLGTSGLAALVEARAAAAERNTELWLVCSRRQVLRPLSIAGLIDLFQIADTLPEALAHV